MADLEAVLADVSYLMAMEKSKLTPAARASKKIVLPDPRLVFQFSIFRGKSSHTFSAINHISIQLLFFICLHYTFYIASN